MTPVLTFIAWALIPAGLLPVATALVLRRYRKARSQALRDRWHVSIAMALVGLVTMGLALDALDVIDIGGESFWIAFGLAVLVADVVSGKWLLEFWDGRFR